MSDANRKPPMDAAESETLRMRGNSLHGNRETLETPSPDDAGDGPRKAYCRTPDMHVSRESDGPIVPEEAGEQSRPEGGGGVRGGKGIDQGKRHSKPYSHRTQSRGSVAWDCGAYEKQRSGIRSCGSPPCCTTSLRHCCGPATSS